MNNDATPPTDADDEASKSWVNSDATALRDADDEDYVHLTIADAESDAIVAMDVDDEAYVELTFTDAKSAFDSLWVDNGNYTPCAAMRLRRSESSLVFEDIHLAQLIH